MARRVKRTVAYHVRLARGMNRILICRRLIGDNESGARLMRDLHIAWARDLRDAGARA